MPIRVEVFGPDPPCIRCHTTLKLATEVANMFEGKVEVARFSLTSDRARFYGTMKKPNEIANLKGINMGPDERMKRMPRNLEEVSPEDKEYIEKKMSPFAEVASEAGLLMSPVLAVNGKVKMAGKVPTKEEIIRFVEDELRRV